MCGTDNIRLTLSLSLTHTHTHIHTHTFTCSLTSTYGQTSRPSLSHSHLHTHTHTYTNQLGTTSFHVLLQSCCDHILFIPFFFVDSTVSPVHFPHPISRSLSLHLSLALCERSL